MINFKIFKYTPKKSYNFTLSSTQENENNSNNQNTDQSIYSNIDLNLKYIQSRFNTSNNSDIIVRNFTIIAKNISYKAFIVYIDGMSNTDLINQFILKPLMLRNRSNTFDGETTQTLNSQTLKNSVSIKNNSKNVNLKDYILSSLLPQNSVETYKEFNKIIENINLGNCALFIDTIDSAFDLDVKSFKQRNIDIPQNEAVIKGPNEAFVENIRTNTTQLRRITNNENLTIESISVGKITNTKVGVCYMKNIANENLVNEVKYRLKNLSLDTLISTGQLEQLIEDNNRFGIPSLISTERPDKCSKFLMQGRVVILVNGNPYAIIAPACIMDFFSSPEDTNINVIFANFLKIIRFIAAIITLLAPSVFIAITNFHQEILPTELLFSILASRENIPFPIIVELLLMEFSFELIRESGLRVPSPIGSTLGIVGALILGDAAVTAHIVSPILIIVVAITGLSSFSVPDFGYAFHLRIYRFLFIFLGYLSGFLGIGLGLLVYTCILCNMKSFGVDFTSPLTSNFKDPSHGYFVKPIWKHEKREEYVFPKKEFSEPKISKKWEH